MFLDTNVVLDFLDRSRRRHPQATSLIDFLTRNGCRICISEDMLTTVYYIAKDKPRVLAFLKVVCDQWEILHFGAELISRAIVLAQTEKLDLEDVLQGFCAQSYECDFLITNDHCFYDCGGITITSSEAFLQNHNHGDLCP